MGGITQLIGGRVSPALGPGINAVRAANPKDLQPNLREPTRAQREDDQLAQWNNMLRAKGMPVNEVYEDVMFKSLWNSFKHTPTTVVGGGIELAKQFVGAYWNTIKENATNERLSFKDVNNPYIGAWGDAAVKAMNIATAGYADRLDQLWEENKDEKGYIKMGSLATDVGADFIGFDMMKELYHGRNAQTGEMLTPEEVGARGWALGLTLIPMGRGIGRLMEGMGKGVIKPPQRVARTKLQLNAELKQMAEGMNLSDVKALGKNFPDNPPIRAALDALNEADPNFNIEKLGKLVTDNKLDPDAVLDVFTEGTLAPHQTHTLVKAVADALGEKLEHDPAHFQKWLVESQIKRMLSDEAPTTTQNVAQLIRDGVLTPDRLQDLMFKQLKEGMTVKELAAYNNKLANTLVKTEKVAGQNLNVMARAMAKAVDDIFPDNPELASAVKAIYTDMEVPTGNFHSFYAKFTDIYKHILRAKRAAATSAPVTTSRNWFSGAMNFGLEFAFERGLVDTANLVGATWGKYVSHTLPETFKLTSTLHNTYQSMFTLAAGMNAAAIRAAKIADYRLGNTGIAKPYAALKEAASVVFDKKDGVAYITKETLDAKSKALSDYWAQWDTVLENMDPLIEAEISGSMGDFQARQVLNYYGEMKGEFWDSIRRKSRAPEGAGRFKQWVQLPWREMASTGADVISILNRSQEMWWRKVGFLQNMDKYARERGYANVTEFVNEVATNPNGLKDSLIGNSHTPTSAIDALKGVQNNLTNFVRKLIDDDPKARGPMLKDISKGMDRLIKERKAENKRRVKNGLEPLEEFTVEDTRTLLESQLATKLNTHIDSTIHRLEGSEVVEGRRYNPTNDTIDVHKEILSKKNVDATMQMLRDLGYEGIDHYPTSVNEALAHLPAPLQKALGIVVENDSTIITRAIDDALSMTFARNPIKGGAMHTILGFYQKMPFLADLGVMFPRFLANQWMWLWERNPTQLLSALDGNTWKGFTKGKINPMTAKKMALGMEGLLMNQTAWFIRNSKLAGPKYYQIDTGAEDDEGNPVYLDARPYNPFAEYLFFQQLARQLATDRELPNKMTDQEVVDGIAGVRRYSDAPIFAIPYIAQAFERGGLEGINDVIRKLSGDALRGFLVPSKTINEIIGGVGELVHDWEGDNTTGKAGAWVAKETLDIKDNMEDELFGSIAMDIPGIRSTLPTRVDPFTGLSMRTTGPLKRQLLGRTTRKQTQWELLLGEVNLAPYDMVGKWRSRSATQLISEEIGKQLMQKLPNGQTWGNNMADRLRKLGKGKPIDIKRQLVQEINRALREEATAKLVQNPQYKKLFVKELTIKNIPIGLEEKNFEGMFK